MWEGQQMSLFTDPIDRFYVGKLVFGLAFLRASVYVLSSLLVIAGAYHPTGGLVASSPMEALWLSGAEAVLTLVGFQLIEHARRRQLYR
jgi:hypothetical protein